METMYAVCAAKRKSSINENRSLIDFTADRWWETGAGLFYNFNREQVEMIKKNMRSKLLYYATIIGTDGSREDWSVFNARTKELKTEKEPQVSTIEIGGFTIRVRM